jgi:pyruvate dehydrogenase (quinone)
MSRTVADVMVQTLQDAGARRCYGVAGDTLNYFTDAIRRSNIRWVHMRHEEAGAFAAGAESMLTDELSLCAGSCGPGSLHFINGIYESNRNRAPVVLIASQIVSDELGFEFPQEVDFKSVYSSGTVFCEEVRTPAQAQRMTAMAAQAALTRRGVAVLIVPVDVSKATAPGGSMFSVHRSRPSVTPHRDELARIADILNTSSRVAIYGGSGCQDAHAQVLTLAEALRAPVARTSRAKDFLGYDNPFDVGMTGVFGSDGGLHALTSCDALLLLGCDFAWRQFYPSKAKIIQIDIDGSHLGRRHPIDLGAVGGIGPTLDALLPLIKSKQESGFLEECIDHARRAEESQSRHAAASSSPIHPQYLSSLISKYAEKDAVFTADGGSPMVWCLRHIKSTGQNRTIISLTHGTMANAMPQALGVKAAFPDRQVISMSGDGGLAMLMGDLLTITQENLAVKIVVVNNGSLGFVELEQKVEGLLDSYTDLKNPDFSKIAGAIGIWGKRVEKSSDLDAAVQEWLSTPGPALLDVVTDRYELVMPPKVEAAQIFGTALYSAKALLAGRGGEVAGLIKNAVK